MLVVNSFLDINVRTGNTVSADGTARAGDYGLTTSSLNISDNLPVLGLNVELWGVPADPAHDASRTCAGSVTPCSVNAPSDPIPVLADDMHVGADYDRRGGLVAGRRRDVDGLGRKHGLGGQHVVGVTGCGLLSFNPTVTATPETSSADSPTGLDVDLHVPQAPRYADFARDAGRPRTCR